MFSEAMRSYLPLWVALVPLFCACATSRKAEQLQAEKPAAVLALPEQYATSFRELDLPTLAQDSAAVHDFQGREVIVMNAVRDSASGEMVASETLEAALEGRQLQPLLRR